MDRGHPKDMSHVNADLLVSKGGRKRERRSFVDTVFILIIGGTKEKNHANARFCESGSNPKGGERNEERNLIDNWINGFSRMCQR